jgi:5-methylthioadenosine/S-adenosylhomocysteine deaminase
MFEVFKSSALLHKAYLLRADVMSAAEVLELATIGGARALNIHSLTGSLEIGKRADILLLDMASPRMIPTYSIVSNLVFAASSRLVHTVLVEGQVVVAEGKCTLLERDEVLQEAQELERFFKTKLH